MFDLETYDLASCGSACSPATACGPARCLRLLGFTTRTVEQELPGGHGPVRTVEQGLSGRQRSPGRDVKQSIPSARVRAGILQNNASG